MTCTCLCFVSFPSLYPIWSHGEGACHRRPLWLWVEYRAQGALAPSPLPEHLPCFEPKTLRLSSQSPNRLSYPSVTAKFIRAAFSKTSKGHELLSLLWPTVIPVLHVCLRLFDWWVPVPPEGVGYFVPAKLEENLTAPSCNTPTFKRCVVSVPCILPRVYKCLFNSWHADDGSTWSKLAACALPKKFRNGAKLCTLTRPTLR